MPRQSRQGGGAGIAAALCCVALAVHPGLALGGSLEGRIVTLNTETTNPDGTLAFVSRGRTVSVGGLVEFALLPEGGNSALDVVPVEVDISANRIEFTYGEEEGWFWEAPFNGYVLRFEVECALFEGFAIDPAFTTLPVTPEHIRTEGGALFINVAGMDYGPESRLALDFQVSDCLLG
ncbi:hypothetical protein [Pseudotabrizicola algicola]|uniref:Uncharacterized protein n=1 Tax=Pseudotabrizicola algicola TaxID=2709381 RepID=A0A6B3RMX9_9RHOB|nr:hypothetical protein [Pseudotabrizicola algicola]NEX46208.1 hypothetical protein [Pseudotabrizicola algicola]